MTAWPVNTDLLVRRTVTLNPATLTADPVLKVAIDNDVDVFFELGGRVAVDGGEPIDLSDQLETNTLAVRAIDCGAIN